jgi:hypothetical protein
VPPDVRAGLGEVRVSYIEAAMTANQAPETSAKALTGIPTGRGS